MKTFKDIEFSTHQLGGGVAGRLFFENGYGASVVGGASGLYGDGVNTFELAVLKGDKDSWDLCYDTPITDDVIGHQTKDEISELLVKIQKL